MNILYLYSEIVGYNIPIFKHLVEEYNFQVHVMHWDHKRLKPFEIPAMNGVTFYRRSEYNFKDMVKLCNEINPSLVYISGWMDSDYLKVTKTIKKSRIPVVVGFDDIWTGSLRQRLGSMIFPIYFKKYFSHAWVAGPYQFEFAKRLGFKNSEIIFDLLTANSKNFTNEPKLSNSIKRNFLYVGNFRTVKGTDILVEAYNLYRSKYKGNWTLTCIGNGELEHSLLNQEGIKIIPFSDESTLIKEGGKSDVFILPSRHDQWGVVIHEFTYLGLPILISENVGSKASFFINKFNGLLFSNNDPRDLAMKMAIFTSFTEEQLWNMGNNSITLAKRINIETSVANLVSIINN